MVESCGSVECGCDRGPRRTDGGWVYRDERGKPHRICGPAVLADDGVHAWFIHGVAHRLDGPSVEWPQGQKGPYGDQLHWDIEGMESTPVVVLNRWLAERGLEPPADVVAIVLNQCEDHDWVRGQSLHNILEATLAAVGRP